MSTLSSEIREPQVTPLPDLVDAPGRTDAAAWLAAAARQLLPWLVPVVLIVAWQTASSLGWLSTRVLPAPIDVVTAAWTYMDAPYARFSIRDSSKVKIAPVYPDFGCSLWGHCP